MYRYRFPLFLLFILATFASLPIHAQEVEDTIKIKTRVVFLDALVKLIEQVAIVFPLLQAEREVDQRRHGAEALGDSLDPDRERRLGAHCSLPRVRRRATCTFTIIDAMIAMPMMRSNVKALTPMMLKPVRMITSTATPMNAPITDP